MSVYFPTDPDGFIQGVFSPILEKKNNISFGGWLKIGSNVGICNIATVGRAKNNTHETEKSGTEFLTYRLEATSDVDIDTTELVPINTWVFFGWSRTSDSLAHVYMKAEGGTKEYIEDTTVGGNWSVDEILSVAFGSIDLDLEGGSIIYTDDLYLQDWFFAEDTVLTEANFDSLAAKDDPRSITGVTNHWLDETGDLAGALLDNVGNVNLSVYDSTDPVSGTPANPPVWSSEIIALNAYAAAASLTNQTIAATAITATPTVSTNKAEGIIYAGIYSQGHVITDGQDIIDEITVQVDSLGSGVVTKVPSVTGEHTLPEITGLEGDTPYVAWFTQIDGDSNITMPVSFGFTTTTYNTISATIVVDNSQTLHADNNTVSWELTEGASSSAQTLVASGDNANIINGILSIDVPTKYVGDELILNADISITNIHGVDTEHFRGSVTVEGTITEPEVPQTIYLDLDGAASISVNEGAFTTSTMVEIETPDVANYVISNIASVVAGSIVIDAGTITDVEIDDVSTGSTTPAMPTDGEFHKIAFIGSGTVTYVGSDDGVTNFFTGGIKQIAVDTSVFTLDQYAIDAQAADGSSGIQVLPAATSDFSDLTDWEVQETASLSSAGCSFLNNADILKLDPLTYDALLPQDCFVKLTLDFYERDGGLWNQLKIHDSNFSSPTAMATANSQGINTLLYSLSNGPGFGIYYATDTGTGAVRDITIERFDDAIVFNDVEYLDYKSTGGQPTPSGNLTFPRICGMNIGAHDLDDPAKRAVISKQDLAILGMYNLWDRSGMTMTEVLALIRGLNPEIILGKYTMPMQIPTNAAADAVPRNTAKADLWDKVDAMDWYLYNEPSHVPLESTTYDQYLVNVTDWTTADGNGDKWMTWKAERDDSIFFTPDDWDFWYFDNMFAAPRTDDGDWDIDGTNDLRDDVQVQWREAYRTHIQHAQSLQPTMKFMGNTSDSAECVLERAEYTGLVDAGFGEHMINDDVVNKNKGVEYWHSWEEALRRYRSMITNSKNPDDPYSVLAGSSDFIADDVTYKTMRYGLTTALLDNGFFAFGSFTTPQWYDEYDVELGEAIDTPPQAAIANGLWQREFDWGIAIVNPKSNATVTIDIAADYPNFIRIDATRLPFQSQDTLRNDGTTNSFGLPIQDGVILLRVGYPYYTD